jgi:predicted nucleic acid-binding protein
LQPSTIRVVVADAGPLIALGRLDHLALLGVLFEQVQVPELVLAECLARPDRPDAQRIRDAVAAGVLVPCDARPVVVAGLDDGERAAIGRAIEIHAGLLVDDLAARHHALSIGLVVVGTLGVLVQAKRKGLVTEIRPLIDRLRASGQRLSHAAVADALGAAGEPG